MPDMKFLFLAPLLFITANLYAQGNSYQDSADYYYKKGQYGKALPFARNSVSIFKQAGVEDSLSIASFYTLGSVYFGLGRYDSAGVYYNIACNRAEKFHGDNSAIYGRYLVDVATIDREAARFEEAEKKYQRASGILAKVVTPFRNDYAFCLIQYAAVYNLKGNLNKCEELLLAAKNVAPAEPLDKKTEYALAMHELGRLYEKMGNYEKQEQVQVQVLGMLKEMFGDAHPAYASAINNLAILYHRKRDLHKADSMYRMSLEIKRKANSDNPSSYIMVLNNLGIVNTDLERYDVAEKYLRENVDIAYSIGGEETLQYPFCLNNLARLYVWSGRLDLADSLFHKSLRIYNKLQVPFNSSRHKQLYDMARFLHPNDAQKTQLYLKEALEIENKLLVDKLDFLSESELMAYLKGIEIVSARPYMFLMEHASPEISEIAYNSILLRKGIVLQNTRALNQNMVQTGNESLNAVWKKYLQQKTSYTNLLLTPIAARSANADSLFVELSNTEKDLLRRSVDYRTIKTQLSVNWKRVQQQLKPGEAAVEFVRFAHRFDTYIRNADTVYYGALLLNSSDSFPRYIHIVEERQLIDAMNRFAYKSATNMRGGQSSSGNPVSASALYNLLWRPLEPYLSQAKRVYFSPDGLLHRIAFAAIPIGKDKLLCDKYELVQVSSTLQVALPQNASRAPISIAAFGGINYNAGLSSAKNVAAVERGINSSFGYLPYTLKEVNSIKKRSLNYGAKPIVFAGNDATEEAFRKLGGTASPQILHFATHGFVLPNIQQQASGNLPAFKMSENPLLRCGLVMTGGNKGWLASTGKSDEDGILTGLEISNVQLPNTELVVLSACETGMGKIEGNEGVFGLQRSFKLAGAQFVMASLWQVPDKETTLFMDTFYTHFLAGKSIRESFLKAQQYMRKSYPPYYWAGFTLIQ